MDILPVLLSAGMGTRLEEKNENLPKALLKINGKYLIFYQLEKLEELGFKKVLIVVGFKESLLKKAIGKNFNGMSIHYVVNEDFYNSGTAYSFYKAKDCWGQDKPSILMLHTDLFYDLSILDNLTFDHNHSFLVTDENYVNNTNDEMVVFANLQHVYKVEKGPKDMLNGVGESLGINFFSKSFCESYFAFLKNFLPIKNNKKFHWEQTLQPFLENNIRCRLKYMGIDKKLWININYTSDLDYAVNIIFDTLYNNSPLKS
jgi:choline kinase